MCCVVQFLLQTLKAPSSPQISIILTTWLHETLQIVSTTNCYSKPLRLLAIRTTNRNTLADYFMPVVFVPRHVQTKGVILSESHQK